MAVLKIPFTVRMNPVDYAKLKKIAEEDNRSVTNMIDTLVKREIKRYEEENGEIKVTDEEIYSE